MRIQHKIVHDVCHISCVKKEYTRKLDVLAGYTFKLYGGYKYGN